MPHSSNRPSNAYSRDLVGYGRTPPHANWPGKAKIAVQFVLNYEEGGRTASFTATQGQSSSCRKSSAHRLTRIAT